MNFPENSDITPQKTAELKEREMIDRIEIQISPGTSERLKEIERLRRNGVISDTNYAIMKQKIINMFVH